MFYTVCVFQFHLGLCFVVIRRRLSFLNLVEVWKTHELSYNVYKDNIL